MRELSKTIKDWIQEQEGWFTSWQLNEALSISTKRDRDLRRQITKRLCDKDILERHLVLGNQLGSAFRVNPRYRLKRIAWA